MTESRRIDRYFAPALALALSCFSPQASAQPYPSKPISVIVGYPPGGGMDTFCRLVTAAVSSRLGQPMVVQNRPGVEGHLALTALARSAPDGYTISCVPHSMTQSPHMSPITIDVLKDLAPVARLAKWQFTLVVRGDHPAKTLPQFIALVKSKPGEISIGTAGAATRLTTALLEGSAGIKLLSVPFPGTAAVQTALLGGHVDAAVGDTTFATLRAVGDTGQPVRPLAVMADKRDPAVPNVPAISEFFPGLDPAAWYGIVAPSGTPSAIIDRLNAEFGAVVNALPLKEQLAARGWHVDTTTPQEFADLIRTDFNRYGVAVKESGMMSK